jgi:photosystem I subunit 4
MTEQNKQSQEQNVKASGGYQTSTDSEERKTGIVSESESKNTAVPESGTSEQPVEGAPNQGTEKR